MDERRDVMKILWDNGIFPTTREIDEIMKMGGLSYVMKKIREGKAYEILRKEESKFTIIRGDRDFPAGSGKSESFRKLFLSRYMKIRKILESRVSLSGFVNLDYAIKNESESTIIAMVRDIRDSKYGRILDLEDPSGHIIAYYNGNENIFPDDVIGVKGNIRNGKMYVKEIVYPGVDNVSKKEKVVNSENGIAFISDLHVGSKMFMKENFLKFIDWLNGEKGKNVKYMIISGDLVDGIGIYPGQERDLELNDIFDQYALLSQYISRIKNDITIFMIPGNHDLVRIAEPQPFLGDEIRKMFPANVIFLSNPAYISIEGFNILIYHGTSLNDLMDYIKGIKYENADTMMAELLKRRHLAPIYGNKVPIAPMDEDYMVIEDIPDLFVTGHIHVHKYSIYYGTILLNASAWQKQTEYQKMHNFNPDPCKVTIKFLNKPGLETIKF